MKQAIILAAGLGSRLSEITKVIPKSLIPINGKAILEKNIEFMIGAGLQRIILVTGYMHEKFMYLKEKYSGNIQIIIVYNPKYPEYNTISSMYYASKYFDMDSYVVTADLYMVENIYKKYSSKDSFYLHMMKYNLEKPEWIAELSEEDCIISVNKNGYGGSVYSGVSFWTKTDLLFIRKQIALTDWENPYTRNMFWDEVLFPHFNSWKVHVKHYDNNDEIFDIDIMNLIKNGL